MNVSTLTHPPTGPRPAPGGAGERRAADHIVRATHHGAGYGWGTGTDHHAGACVWRTGTTTGEEWDERKTIDI